MSVYKRPKTDRNYEQVYNAIKVLYGFCTDMGGNCRACPLHFSDQNKEKCALRMRCPDEWPNYIRLVAKMTYGIELYFDDADESTFKY